MYHATCRLTGLKGQIEWLWFSRYHTAFWIQWNYVSWKRAHLQQLFESTSMSCVEGANDPAGQMWQDMQGLPAHKEHSWHTNYTPDNVSSCQSYQSVGVIKEKPKKAATDVVNRQAIRKPPIDEHSTEWLSQSHAMTCMEWTNANLAQASNAIILIRAMCEFWPLYLMLESHGGECPIKEYRTSKWPE